MNNANILRKKNCLDGIIVLVMLVLIASSLSFTLMLWPLRQQHAAFIGLHAKLICLNAAHVNVYVRDLTRNRLSSLIALE